MNSTNQIYEILSEKFVDKHELYGSNVKVLSIEESQNRESNFRSDIYGEISQFAKERKSIILTIEITNFSDEIKIPNAPLFRN